MSRLARIGLALGLFALLGVVMWVLLRPSAPPAQRTVEGLSATVQVSIGDTGTASIDAETPHDALAGLGYVHGLRRGWTLALWRRTAEGTLSEWFGEGTLPLDRHARRLGLKRHAQAAYEALSPATRKRLQAYTRGVNTALKTAYVHEQDPFILIGKTPQRWAPWTPLVIERLWAWIGTAPVPPSELPPPARAFYHADQQWRRWLHLHGGQRSMAWATPRSDSIPATLFQRHVLGATATPVLQNIQLQRPSRPTLHATTVPGVPLLPTGTTDDHAWAYLLRSSASLQQLPVDTAAQRTWHSRISPLEHSERLVTVRRQGSALRFPSPPQDSSSTPPDSLWTLQWPGFSAKSDLTTWLNRSGIAPAVPPPSFQLFTGSGLRLSESGSPEVLGQPHVVERSADGELIVIGSSSWAEEQAEALNAQRPVGDVDIGRWSASDSSTWAATLLSQYQDDLRPFADAPPPASQALAYLQNWDHKYEPASIGASLFEHWMRAYRANIGRLPTPDAEAFFGSYRRRKAFRQALDTLTARYGPDVRRWRWERVVPDRRHIPVWSADSLVTQDLSALSSTRYAPLERPGRGHPSTAGGGPALVDPLPTAPSPTTWDGWMVPADSSLTVRRLRFNPEAFFARSLLRPGRPDAVRLTPPEAGPTTTLVPSDAP